MIKKIGIAVLTASLFFSLAGCNFGSGGQSLTEAKTLTDNEELDGYDLNGYTVTVKGRNVKLNNVVNGSVIISSKVKDGAVTISGSELTSLTVDSKANIILEDTKINEFEINDNAVIKTRKSSSNQAKFARAAGMIEESSESVKIERTVIKNNVTVEVEGGAFDTVEIITGDDGEEDGALIADNDSTATIRKMLWTDKSGNVIDGLQLNLENDESYTGKGAQIKVSGQHKDAEIIELYTVKDGMWNSVLWAEDSEYNDEATRAKVKANKITYEYLNAGEEYEIIFKYYKHAYYDRSGNGSDKLTLLNTDVIKVTPSKGRELSFNKEDSIIKVDVATGDITWEETPEIPAKKGAIMSYYLHSIDDEDTWRYIGGLDKKVLGEDLFEGVNIYKDFDLYWREKVFQDKVVLTVEYKYDGFKWNIYSGYDEQFIFDSSKFAKLEINNNVIKFVNKPKLIPEDADGYYIWAFVGNKGVYKTFNDTKKFDDIDMNVLVGTTPELADAIKANDNIYEFDIAWYKVVDGENKWISNLAHKAEVEFTPIEGYEPIALEITDNYVLKIKKPGDKLLEAMKKENTKVSCNIYAYNESKKIWITYIDFPLEDFTADISENLAEELSSFGHLLKETNYKIMLDAAFADEKNWNYYLGAVYKTVDSKNPVIDFEGFQRPVITVDTKKMEISMTAPGTKLLKKYLDMGANEYNLGFGIPTGDDWLWLYENFKLDEKTTCEEIGKTKVSIHMLLGTDENEKLLKAADYKIQVSSGVIDTTQSDDDRYICDWNEQRFDMVLDGYTLPDSFKQPVFTIDGDILNLSTLGSDIKDYYKAKGVKFLEINIRTRDAWAEEIQEDEWSECWLFSKVYPIDEGFETEYDLSKLMTEGSKLSSIKNDTIYVNYDGRNTEYWNDTTVQNVSVEPKAFIWKGYKDLLADSE